MAYRHILWAPGGDDVTTHFAIAGPDLKLFWEQLQQERAEAGFRRLRLTEPLSQAAAQPQHATRRRTHTAYTGHQNYSLS